MGASLIFAGKVRAYPLNLTNSLAYFTSVSGMKNVLTTLTPGDNVIKHFFLCLHRLQLNKLECLSLASFLEAVFLVMCDPSMNEL